MSSRTTSSTKMTTKSGGDVSAGDGSSSELSGGLSIGGGEISVGVSGGGVSGSEGGVSVSGGGVSIGGGGVSASGSGISVNGVNVSVGGGISTGGSGSGSGGFVSGGVGGGSASSSSIRSSYKPISQSRGTFQDFQKKSVGGTVTQTSIPGGTGLALLSASSISMQTGVDSEKKGRVQQKKDLQELNQRFASYIEKARFLEAQNKNLVTEIEFLKGGNTNDNSKIKEMYEVEIAQLRKLLNDSEKSKAPLELKISSLEKELDDIVLRFKVLENTNSEYRVTIDRQRKEIMGLESELVIFRRTKSSYDDDLVRYKSEINNIKEDLKKTRQDYDCEALARINLEHDLQALKETLEFERQVNETEIKNVSGVAYRDTTKENQIFWQNEMARALREIQGEYENKLIVMKQEIEGNYALQLQEVRTSKTRENVETSHLRDENVRTKSSVQGMKSRVSELEKKVSEYEYVINQLREDLEESQRQFELERLMLQEDLTTTKTNLTQTLVELQSILDAKLGLELEICAYRKLLELEETRVNASVDGDSTVSQFISLTGGGGSYGSGGLCGSGGLYGSGGSHGSGGLYGLGGSHGAGGSYGAGGSFSASGSVSGGILSGGLSLSTGGESTSGGGLTLGGGSSTGGMSYVEKNESDSQRIKFRKTTKGNISFAEIDLHGKYICLENIGSNAEELSGMVIKRSIDGVENKVNYKIPKDTSLNAAEKLRICANGNKTGKGKELEMKETSWGFGDDIKTELFDSEGEVKATHIQEIPH